MRRKCCRGFRILFNSESHFVLGVNRMSTTRTNSNKIEEIEMVPLYSMLLQANLNQHLTDLHARLSQVFHEVQLSILPQPILLTHQAINISDYSFDTDSL